MSKGYIEIKSVKGVKAPVPSKLEVSAEKNCWNIRFNIPLNPATVSEENMDVTDIEGFILTSVISYVEETNSIIISPMEPYKPSSTYVLNISSNVRSKGNNPLKEEVQIIFQLKGSVISNFKILKGEERLDIDIKPSKNAPTPSQLKKDKLATISLKINFWVAVGAMLVFVAALLTRLPALMILGTILLLAGIAHIVYQYTNKEASSIKNYNKGALCYNDSEYADASEFFDLSLMQNPNNIFAQRGKKRLSAAYAAKKRG